MAPTLTARSTLPLVVITGPTASGKTGLAVKLAERWNGEIICADSRTVYKDMNIGTAKPTVAEQARVRHWLLDVVSPGERFTVADFQRRALAAIDDIRRRGKIPFLVGGTGLYIDAVVLGFTFGPDVDAAQRRELEKMTVDQLQALIKKQHIAMPENALNKRHLIRCIEKNNSLTSRNTNPDTHTYVVAIRTERAVLEARIRQRASDMFAAHIVQETQHLVDKYGRQSEAMTGNIYPVVLDMLEGRLTPAEAEERFVVRDRQLVKRQLTWLRRHDWVRWLSLEEAEQYFVNLLAKYRDD